MPIEEGMMPLEADKIANFRILYWITEKETYEYCAGEISKYDSAQIVPVIINIAEEIKEKQQDNAEDGFINKAITVMKKVDELHEVAKVSTYSASTFLSEHFPLGIKHYLDQLLESAKKAVVNPEYTKLWREAACWLEGLYRRSIQSYNEQYAVTAYAIDWAIGLNQIEMAGYLHNIAEEILKKITPKSAYEANNSMLLFGAMQSSPLQDPSPKNEMEPPKFQ